MRFTVEMMKRQRAFKTWAPQDGWAHLRKERQEVSSLSSSIGFQNLSSWGPQKATDRRSMWHGRILSAGAGGLICFLMFLFLKYILFLKLIY
ncbi:hypothetical protein NC651_013501 [Populus alba x Populus x berolinensis]|nr:hypothetical protein NC651_013501 [Populus alba x Populus x berolinensis]